MIEIADNKTARERSADAASWEAMFAAARAYYVSHGDLDVPWNYVTTEGERLGAWLNRQRQLRDGKRKGGISDERVRKLDSIGMSWLDRSEERWNRNFRALRAYYARHGDLDVPQNYVTTDGLQLGQFVKNMRHHRDTKYRKCLTPDRVVMLTEMGMIWDVNEYRWHQGFKAAQQYFRMHGDLQVPRRFVTRDSFNLGSWISYQRKKHNQGELSEEHIKQLNSIGMIWKQR